MAASKTTDSLSTILIVDDDREGRTFLADNLTADGYEVIEAGTRTAARQLMATRFLDLVLIRAALRGGHGLDLVAMVRQADLRGTGSSELMVIVVCDGAGELDTLRCYERGCDEVVSGSPSYVELRARIGAVLRRRTSTPVPRRLRVGPLVVEVLSRQAWLGGKLVELSNKEFTLLRLLASEPSRVFTREELLRAVWGWDDPAAGLRNTRTLDSHASRLRRKLAVGDVQYVINVWGIGYRLTDLVTSDQLLPA
jgi:DNA-binding response OmpR family regulator